MNYRSICDLNSCIAQNAYRIPRDTDLVVGVPRSGLLAGSIFALQLNLPLTDVEGLIKQRILSAGPRLARTLPPFEQIRKVLVVDDSVHSGREMSRTRERLADAALDLELIFCAPYIAPGTEQHVDIFFKIVPLPRVFGWNVMHHSNLKHSCVDIDGVLCRDPTETENDDGPGYRHFLETTEPLFIPKQEIGALVTSRLEKYRPETQAWLDRQGVKYRELVMLDLPSMAERRKRAIHGSFKAEVYRERQWAKLFIESSVVQAIEIANRALKPVVCTADFELYQPGLKRLSSGVWRKGVRKLTRPMKSLRDDLKQRLLRMNRW